MKKTALFLISVLAILPLFAQPVLNNDLNFAIGDTYKYDTYTDVSDIDPGPGGADLVWNFGTISGGSYLEGYSVICVDPTTTAFADSAAVANANICIRNKENPDVGPYQYYECNSSSQNLIALGFLGGGGSFSTYIDVQTALEFPFAYGSSFDDTWECWSYNIGDGYYYTRDSSIVTIEADAYGTITTPAGEFQNVLRVKRTTIHYSWYDFTGGGFGTDVPDPYTEIQYDWFAPNMKVPVMIIQEIDWLPGYIVRYLAAHSFTTGIEERADYHLEIFPNPATDRVTIKTDQVFNSVSIYSINGQLLDAATSQTGQRHQQTIDLSKYAKGVYIIELGFEDGNVVKKKIIKQ